MVSAAPNLTRVSGTILERRPHPTLPGWELVSLAVESTAPVEGLHDLVGPRLAAAGAEGKAELEVAVPGDLLGQAGPGWRLSARVKLTPDGPMARPDPAGGESRVQAPGAAGP